MVTYQHKESGVVCGFIGYTSDGSVGLTSGGDRFCFDKEYFESWYRNFNPKNGDLLESENFVVKFWKWLNDDYEHFLGEIIECKSGGAIEGTDTFAFKTHTIIYHVHDNVQAVICNWMKFSCGL